MASRRVVLAFLGAVAGAAVQARCRDAPPTAPRNPQAETITASTILEHIRAIADDSTRGRFTPSPEIDKVAAYVARAFRRSGLRPGLASGYVQTYPVPETLVVRASGPHARSGDSAVAPNVVGVLEGTDAALRDEYVLLVAHMDHLGVRAPVNGDSIMNGADDNASGTAAVLELARAFGALAQRPRRSMIFLLVSGEEEGLWGSRYYATHPTVPLAQTVAAVNLDMIGRNARDSVFVLGAELSSLGSTTQRVAGLHPELGMRPVALLRPLGGSDHVPFAEHGVPVLFFFSGFHGDYHRPSDAADLIDGEKEARIVRLVFYLALDLADGAARPVWYAAAGQDGAPVR